MQNFHSITQRLTVLVVTAFALTWGGVVSAQSWDSIKKSSQYLCGEGWGASIAEADQAALADLVSKISVTVSSRFELTEEERTSLAGVDAGSYVKSKVSTFSNATLTNTQRLIIENEPDAHVGRYIKASDVSDIFNARRVKVKDYADLAMRAETEGRIDDALRCYWWAYTLTKSLPVPASETYVDRDGDSHLLITWIPEQMNNIFTLIRVRSTGVADDEVRVEMLYKGSPVSSIDYTYFDGQDWSKIYSARDGRGVLDLVPGAASTNLQLKIEYEYRGEAHIDKEVQSVMQVIKSPAMRKSYITFDGSVSIPSAGRTTVVGSAAMGTGRGDSSSANSGVRTISTGNPASSAAAATGLGIVPDPSPYIEVIQTVTDAVRAKEYTAADGCFTNEGREIYHKLLQYGNATVLNGGALSFYKSGDKVYARSVPMSFSFRNGLRKSFVEGIVFTFDSDGKIENLSFGLGEQAESDILGKGVWAAQARVILMDFLENYKTAFALKRYDYIESIFDENAVIIVGKMVRKAQGNTTDTAYGNLSMKQVQYVRHTKDSYMAALKRSFQSNEFINIRFADNDVIKMASGGELYGIQIRQDYYSSNYGDSGYLTILVDLNDPDRPLIKVRTWQPERDPEFGLITPYDF